MGMSVYSEDLAKDYFCEQCKPENHKELLEGMERGERPWEERRRIYEEEKASGKKKKGGRKAKPKRSSDIREDSAKASPPPEPRKDPKTIAGFKRKSRSDSEDHEVKVTYTPFHRCQSTDDIVANRLAQETQKRKLAEKNNCPTYIPPDDLPEHITDLVDARQPPARGLFRAISEVLSGLEKKGEFSSVDNVPVELAAERFAIQIERAVHDEHPSHKEYGAQIRTLRFNLKENSDLSTRLLASTLTPPMLAVMTSDDLASSELQRKTAKMKAQAERQSILGTEDTAPRLRRTHKGEELVEKDNATLISEDKPPTLRRQSNREALNTKPQVLDHPKSFADPQANTVQRQSSVKGSLHIETQQGSPHGSFDIKKVFSSVRSPVTSHAHRPSYPQPPNSSMGPGADPEVDRLLQDGGDESPPYSPSDDTDPDVVWKGSVAMKTVANFQATARHIGGVNLTTTIGLPWSTLIPKTLTVAGRIDEQIATEYLCSLRYSAPTDVTVASLSPATDAANTDFLSLVDYFTARKRYGVVGEKGVGNVRDTYLVPVPAGTSSHPEFMLNLEDNFIPISRAAPMLLLVVVYRNDEAAMEKLRGPNWARQYDSHIATTATPTPTSASDGIQMSTFSDSVSGSTSYAQPAPTQMAFLSPQAPSTGSSQPATFPITDTHSITNRDAAKESAQREGEAVAKEILGPLSLCPTAVFLMSQAARMQKNEWMLVRDVFERQPQARNDLQFLKRELEKYQELHSAALPARPSQTPIPIPRVPHSAISPRSSQPPTSGAQPTTTSST